MADLNELEFELKNLKKLHQELQEKFRENTIHVKDRLDSQDSKFSNKTIEYDNKIEDTLKHYKKQFDSNFDRKVDELTNVYPLKYIKIYTFGVFPLSLFFSLIVFLSVAYCFKEFKDNLWVFMIFILGLGYGAFMAFKTSIQFIIKKNEVDRLFTESEKRLTQLINNNESGITDNNLELFKVYLRDLTEYLKEDPKD